MNPAFFIIIIIVAILLWFLLSFVFFPLGKLIYKVWKNAYDNINKKDEKINKEKGEKEHE